MADKKRYNYAMELYREALNRFHGNTAVWAEAAWRLSIMLDEQMGMPNEAADLWRQIMRRTPNSKIGRFAGARIQKRIARSHRPTVL